MYEQVELLREAARTVRLQIPNGALTRASVERLVEAAEAVCAASPRAPAKLSATVERRLASRAKWARIARENATR